MDIELHKADGYTLVTLTGECRFGEAQPLIEMLHPIASESGASIAIDLSGLDGLDSSGLSALINIVTRARVAGSHAVLISPSPFVDGVLDVTRLNKWFDIYPDLGAAERAFGLSG